MQRGAEQVADTGYQLVMQHFSHFLEGAERHGPLRRGSSIIPTSGLIPSDEPSYLDLVKRLVVNEESTLHVDFTDVIRENQELADAILAEFYRYEAALRAALSAVASTVRQQLREEDTQGAVLPEYEGRTYFVSFYNLPSAFNAQIGRLVSVSGTVTRTSEVRPELLHGTFLCLECANTVAGVEQQFRFTEPVRCSNQACSNRTKWKLVVPESKFVDWQRLRVQENSDEIPAGSMPRSLDVVLRGDTVEKAKPGDKCVFTGCLVAVPDVAQLMRPGEVVQGVARGGGRRTRGENGMAPGEGVTGLRQLGVRDLTYKLAFLVSGVARGGEEGGAAGAGAGLEVDDGEEGSASRELVRFVEALPRATRERIREMKATPNLYQRMARSIAPAVCGHEEVKRGILLMLLGGVNKRTPEGIKLRGDVNVCVVGDPSTAKSQFLKYICRFMPRAIYTSGKASSAAGLTASVAKDPDTGEFAIEAGALMLADNGICCIDEFDKMETTDQVAIHEAMEQQTISITKAGIQATLNARASILAAANPIYGRYDRTKTLRQNIAMTAPIMSRFDLFFVVLDECDSAVDAAIARHIVGVHQHRERSAAIQDAEFTTEDMQSYIALARRLKPIITPEAQMRMIQLFKRLRANDAVGATRASYRITVRQLESMIRLSEALARLHLSSKVVPAYVDEAYRLLRRSVIHVESGDRVELDDELQPFDDSGKLMAMLAGPPSRRKKGQAADEGAEAGLEVEAEAGEAAEEGSGMDVEEAEAGLADTAEQPAAPEAEAPAAPATRRFLSLDEYQRIATDMAERIRQLEGEEIGRGVLQGELIAWYLGTRDDIDSEAQLAAEREVLRRVLRRLRRVDNVLLVADEDSIMQTDEDRLLLTVHPHYGQQ